MSSWREDPLVLQEEDPEPGWSGLYDPWNGRRREQTPFDLFPASELYYNTEDSDYEDDIHTPDQHEEEQDSGDEHEVTLRMPSPRSPSPLSMALYTIFEEEEEEEEEDVKINGCVVGQPYVVGFMRLSVQSQGIKRRKDEEDNNEEAPPSRRQRVNPVEETEKAI